MRILNVHCAFGISLKACLLHCLRKYPAIRWVVSSYVLVEWCVRALMREGNLHCSSTHALTDLNLGFRSWPVMCDWSYVELSGPYCDALFDV